MAKLRVAVIGCGSISKMHLMPDKYSQILKKYFFNNQYDTQGGDDMNNANKEHENQYDSLKDITEFQNNMFNPGHYIGTGKVPPTVSAPGNAMPLTVVCFIATIVFLGFGLFLFFGNVTVTSGELIKSQIINKIIALVIMLVISVFCLLLGFRYFKKAKVYYKEKSTLQEEKIDETVEDQLWQRTCPKCGISHDFDYPKCPNCKFSYID